MLNATLPLGKDLFNAALLVDNAAQLPAASAMTTDDFCFSGLVESSVLCDVLYA